ncbi:MAG: hypothetical protein WD397_17505 [Wenzhouxiangellaceae bacterium]
MKMFARNRTSIEKSGTGIAKKRTGIEKSGTGMFFSLVTAGIVFMSGISGNAIASSFDGAVYARNGSLFITLSGEQLILSGVGQLDSGYGIVRIDEQRLTERQIGDAPAEILIEGSGTGKDSAADDGVLIEGSGTGKPGADDGTLIEGSGTGASSIGGRNSGSILIEGSGTGSAGICGPAEGVLIEGSGTGESVDIEGSGTGESVDIEDSGTGESVDIEGSGTGESVDIEGSGTGDSSKSAHDNGVLIEGSGTGASSVGGSFVMIEGSGTGSVGDCKVKLEWGYAEVAISGNVASVLLYGISADHQLVEIAALELPVIEQ